MNRKFRRKRLALSTGVDQRPTPNLASLNLATYNYNLFNRHIDFKYHKLRENTNRQRFLSFRGLLILLILGSLISLVKYVNSQTATQLLVASTSTARNSQRSTADTNVNNFFQNDHLLENHFPNEFSTILNIQNDQLVNNVQHLPVNKNNQKQATTSSTTGANQNQRTNQLVNKSNKVAPINSDTNNNRSTRTNSRPDNRRLKAVETKKQRTPNNTDDFSPSVSTQSASKLSNATTSKPTQSTVQSADKSTNKQINKQQSTNKQENKNANNNDSKLNGSEVVSSRPTVAGDSRPEKIDPKSDEIAEESLKVESIGASSVEYITEDEEKKNSQLHGDPAAGESNQEISSNDLLNMGYRVNSNNGDGDGGSENKDIYTDSQGEYLFHHQLLPHKMQYESEIQRLDGWNNNLGHLDWGSCESQLSRKVASNYADGVYMVNDDLPSPRQLSQALMRGEDGQSSSRNLTTMFALFGQVLSSEILMASESGCPIEYQAIKIEKCDPMFDRNCKGDRTMPFHRAIYDPNTGQSPNSPREQLNMVTSWIDGSFVYSTYETWLNQMRSFRNGTLRIDLNTGYPPKNTRRVPLTNGPPAHHFKLISPERMFVLGDPRTNQNPALLSFSILLYKWHNVLAGRVQKNNPQWNDEDVFQRARRLLISSLQNIFLYEYLPILLDEKIPKYDGYKPDLHPGVSHSFQSAAFRFGHTMIPPGLYMRDANCNFKKTRRGFSGLRLCASWWNGDEILNQIEMEELLMGLVSQLAEKEDAILCSDVRDKLFGPMNFSRRDLAALNIMRGRDNGLADYMTVREAFGLPRLNWTQIVPTGVRKADFEREAQRIRKRNKKSGKKKSGDNNGDQTSSNSKTGDHGVEKRETRISDLEPEIEIKSIVYPENYNEFSPLEKRLFQLYNGDINSIDVYVGGMLESDPNEGRPGPLFRKIILEQFLRIRDSDRFWFENTANNLFSKDEIEEIKNIKLWDILVNTTSIPINAIQKNVFQFSEDSPCPQPSQIRSSMLEPCVIMAGWDYFHGSEITYILVTLSLVFIPILIALIAYGVMKLQNRIRRKMKAKQDAIVFGKNYDKLYVKEWLDPNHKRYVKVKIGPEPALYTISRKNEVLRKIDFTKIMILVVEITVDCNHKPMVLIPTPRDHDLVLQFQNTGSQKKFLTKLEHFLLNQRKVLQIEHRTKSEMLANAETKEKRQKRLEHFFREAYAITFLKKTHTAVSSSGKPLEKYTELNNNHKDAPSNSTGTNNNDDVIMVMKTSLSKQEFAQALGMRLDSLFVKQMFNCVDKDKDGRISFQEFLDTVVLFTRGKAEDKLRIIFDMCDYDGTGVIEKNELHKMLTSLVDIAKTSSMSEDQVYNLIEELFAEAGLQDKKELTYDDFKLMMKDHKGNFIAIGLDLKGAKQNFLSTSKNIARMTSFQISSEPEPEPGYLRLKWNTLATYLEENRQNIVYLLIFFVICSILFLERFVTYCFLSEHQDLRHIMGPFIALTRGSASALSFCYALLLLTMSRNLMTRLRETSIHQYIPFDSHVQFHKIVAGTALFFTILHCIGHIVNFLHISQQSHENLKCLGIFFFSDNKPNFQTYIFMTVPGSTGLALFAIVCLIFIFAHHKVRLKAYSYFWTVHQLYILFYLLTLLHGMAKITGTPRFWIFFIIPAIIFTIDKILSLQTKYMELDILETEILPSDVTYIKFSRPPNFKYLSGQWVRLACTAFRPNEYHSFTLTSAPHQAHLSVHVKATGVWTNKLRSHFHPNNRLRLDAAQKINAIDEKDESINEESHRPIIHPVKIKIEGPFGGGNQDWYKYEIAVMIGGGIGVTPYASILNDLVFGTSTNRYSGVACKKVYFLWVCSSHKHFEWFIDVLRDVERKDVTQVLEIHIFITQFFHKFDLRTTMLYICENHFQRLSNKSMFTGLKANNHFGRPDLTAFLKFIQKKHSYVSKVGVFSCGPTTLTRNISTACETVNNQRKLPYFLHQFENF